MVLQDLQDRIAAENNKCLISGDFNFNLLNVDNHSQTQEFLDSMFAHSFIPLINKPTRVTSTSATLIDNICCNILPPPNSGILVSDISDHFPIFTLFPFTSNTYSFPSGCFRNTSDANLRSFKSDLDSCDWSVVFNTNPNVSFNNFMNIFNNLCDINVPIIRTKRSNRKSQPRCKWITSALLKSINYKNRLYHKYLRFPYQFNRQKYIRYRNLLTTILRSAK